MKHSWPHALIIRMPDFSWPFEVVADASTTALGVVLLQDGHPIVFESRKFKPTELNYSTMEQELVVLVHIVCVWCCYLEGSKFTLVIDHCPNTFFKTQPTLNKCQARWPEIFQPYNFKWEYRPRWQNMGDPLNRIPESSVVMLGGPSIRLRTSSRLHQ